MQSFHPQVSFGSVRAQFQTVLGFFSVRFYRPTLQLFQSCFAALVLIVGDQVSYSFNYLDAVGLLAKPFMKNGGQLIGRWPTEGYEFDESEALDGDEFLGLGVDNDNEEELTEERITGWVEVIKDKFK